MRYIINDDDLEEWIGKLEYITMRMKQEIADEKVKKLHKFITITESQFDKAWESSELGGSDARDYLKKELGF